MANWLWAENHEHTNPETVVQLSFYSHVQVLLLKFTNFKRLKKVQVMIEPENIFNLMC